MKISLALFFSLFAGAAMAAEPGYTCAPESGCREVAGPSVDIGRGAMLDLPFGWRAFSYPTAPLPIMAGLREFRAFKNGMVVAISPIPNVDKRVITEDQLCGIVAKASEKYVRQSKEQAIVPVGGSHGELVECHIAFTAANAGEKPFVALPNRHHASVTNYVTSYKSIIFSITAVSEQLPDEEFQNIVKSIQQIH